ncbi:hypothetical protein NQ317_006573 [Molorchus minor]|uniref:Carboxylic ester hydrolase n=1 Tax=Molorchus minor TaxID=1323400 RepID=A0ABQ9K1B1_9CUCU|nr:hypothetical protein NQ317_006573 [Molorchus minor]
MALKWIQKNIHKFGGDPKSVTVFGESAGGASAHLHMTSPMSKGLFHKAIMESGTAFCTWSLPTNKEGCPTKPSTKMVECLRNVDAYTIIDQDTKFMEWDYDPMIPFKPVIEPDVKGAFITEHPAETITSGRSAQIPLIVGLNTEDGALKVAGMAQNLSLVKEFNEGFHKLAPMSLMYHRITKNTECATEAIKKYYFNGMDIDKSEISNLVNMPPMIEWNILPLIGITH